jgi:hypothetical protein
VFVASPSLTKIGALAKGKFDGRRFKVLTLAPSD